MELPGIKEQNETIFDAADVDDDGISRCERGVSIDFFSFLCAIFFFSKRTTSCEGKGSVVVFPLSIFSSQNSTSVQGQGRWKRAC